MSDLERTDWQAMLLGECAVGRTVAAGLIGGVIIIATVTPE